MKNIFKLAAVAVSMALVTSLVACSSGDDDVVDATTPKYLLTAQINQYVDSIKYEQNVSDDEIESLKKAHEAVMDMLGDCEDCLAAYFKMLTDKDNGISNTTKLSSNGVTSAKDNFVYYESYKEEKEYHKVYVYKPAIEDALKAVSDAEDVVDDIGNPDGNTILKGALNDRQTASMKAYTDAVAALKSLLNDTDKKTCEAKIDNADKAIKDFNELENKKVTKAEITKVIDAVEAMCDNISTKVVDTIKELPRN